MNVVVAGFGIDIDDWLVWFGVVGVEDIVCFCQVNGYGIDENIVVIIFVEIGFVVYGWDVDIVFIVFDVGDYVIYQVLGFFMVWCVKMQCIYQCYWVCIYGEDIVQDIVYICCCVLIGFDIGWVVVVFYFEDISLVIIDIDDICIFVWFLDDFFV